MLNDHHHGHVHDLFHAHVPDHPVESFLISDEKQQNDESRQAINPKASLRMNGEVEKEMLMLMLPAVGFFGLILGVSSTSKVSRFKLSGRI